MYKPFLVSSLFKTGLINILFTNITEHKKIKEFATLKNGYPFKNEIYHEQGLYNILTISNVTGEKYINNNFKNNYPYLPKDLQPHQLLKSDDILISMTGNVGRVSLNQGTNNLLNQRVGLLKSKIEQDSKYIFYCINNKKFENEMIKKGQGAAQLNISKEDIENFCIPYADNSTKRKIINILDLYYYKLEFEKNRLDKLIQLKTGFMQSMFV